MQSAELAVYPCGFLAKGCQQTANSGHPASHGPLHERPHQLSDLRNQSDGSPAANQSGDQLLTSSILLDLFVRSRLELYGILLFTAHFK
jgi:hypothetical protein